MSSIADHSPSVTAGETFSRRLFREVGRRAVLMACAWRARMRQRRELLMLNDVELRELSLTETDVNREANKLFWQDIHF